MGSGVDGSDCAVAELTRSDGIRKLVDGNRVHSRLLYKYSYCLDNTQKHSQKNDKRNVSPVCFALFLAGPFLFEHFGRQLFIALYIVLIAAAILVTPLLGNYYVFLGASVAFGVGEGGKPSFHSFSFTTLSSTLEQQQKQKQHQQYFDSFVQTKVNMRHAMTKHDKNKMAVIIA